VPPELVFDVLDTRLDLLGNRADVRNLWHFTPALVVRGIVSDRPPRRVEFTRFPASLG
jgi:hypothetical protein